MTDKTHWLESPNKNYLGHWDLPNGKDQILTIKSASWELVESPMTGRSKEKRVIMFVETYEWIKPFICNSTNAQMILKMTGQRFMEDSGAMKIRIGLSQTKFKGEEVDCLRVRNVPSKQLDCGPVTKSQADDITASVKPAGIEVEDFCASFEISKIEDLPKSKYVNVMKRLAELSKETEKLSNENN